MIDDSDELAWLSDLLSPVEAVRRKALDRHAGSVARYGTAQRECNAIWLEAGQPAPTRAPWAAQWDTAWQARQAAFDQTIHGGISKLFAPGGDHTVASYRRALSFAVLYLQWEDRFPEEWKASTLWSAWGSKGAILRFLNRRGVTRQAVPPLAELVIAAVERDYRCEDWRYARLARQLDASFLRPQLEAVLERATDPLRRSRAELTLWAVNHPSAPINRYTWQRRYPALR